MTPHDVLASSELLTRFRNEVAYRDRVRPPDAEVEDDAKRLSSKDAALIVAWLWPNPSYESDSDPFAEAGPGSPTQNESTTVEAIDRDRRSRMLVVGRRFHELVGLAGRAVGRSEEDLSTHLAWSVPISRRELARLRHGHSPFPFSLIVELCDALQLEFTDGWILVDPQRLSRRIDESVAASAIADRLRVLTLENLEALVKKLPQGATHSAQRVDSYRAPGPSGRYRSLYETLAANVKPAPTYTTAEIDALLVAAGEEPLPASARADKSWWAGTGACAEGRPQVSAWWAAGYRVENVELDTAQDQVTSVGFKALPGRTQWLAEHDRTLAAEYRPPAPERISLYRHENDLYVALMSDWEPGAVERVGNMLADAIKRSTDAIADRMAPILGRPYVPSDPDIRDLVDFLDTAGEADRGQIEQHFAQVRPSEPDVGWMTNLLTRARRQGWTVNHGTRRQPRWATTRMMALTIADIADALDLEPPMFDPRDPVPVDFLRRAARAAGVGEEAGGVARSVGRLWNLRAEPGSQSSNQRPTPSLAQVCERSRRDRYSNATRRSDHHPLAPPLAHA